MDNRFLSRHRNTNIVILSESEEPAQLSNFVDPSPEGMPLAGGILRMTFK